MANLRQMSRILYHHEWTSVDDWARNVAELADLNDDEIQQLEHCSGAQAGDGRRLSNAGPARPSPAPRSHSRAAGLLGSMRLALRRAF